MFLSELLGTNGCTEIRPAVGGDVDPRACEDRGGFFMVPVLGYQPGFRGVGKVAKAGAFGGQSVPPTT